MISELKCIFLQNDITFYDCKKAEAAVKLVQYCDVILKCDIILKNVMFYYWEMNVK